MNNRPKKLFALPVLMLTLCLSVLALPSTAKAEDFNLAMWRNTWGGASLGTSITCDQLAEINSGSLSTIKLGDYWTLDGKVFRVADYDYYYGQNGCTDHDLILVPDEALGIMVMNSQDGITTGYFGSEGRTTLQSTVKDALPSQISDNLLTHSMYMSTATDSSEPYSNTWAIKESNGIELMSVVQVFGSEENITSGYGNNDAWKEYGYSSYSTDTQISLFKFASDGTKLATADYRTAAADNIVKSYSWWLSSTMQSSWFARISNPSFLSIWPPLYFNSANYAESVRPAITIKGTTGHSYGTPSYTWAADNSSVTASRTCSKCSYKDEQTVKTETTVTQEADCTKPELTTYTAAFTNTAFSTQTKENIETKAALGHNAAHHDAVDATCTEDGSKEYWTCSRCNKYFSDEACTTEISQPETIAATGHKLVDHARVEPTATEEGTEEYWECSVCGFFFSDAEGKNVISNPIVIPPTGKTDDDKPDDGKSDDGKKDDGSSKTDDKKDDASDKKSDDKSSSQAKKVIPQTGDATNLAFSAAAALAGVSLVCGGLAFKKH